jgi:hypothetical protein
MLLCSLELAGAHQSVYFILLICGAYADSWCCSILGAYGLGLLSFLGPRVLGAVLAKAKRRGSEKRDVSPAVSKVDFPVLAPVLLPVIPTYVFLSAN